MIWGVREREELKIKATFLACVTRRMKVPFTIIQEEKWVS